MLLARGPGGGLIIKANTRNMTSFLKGLEREWKTLKPGAPFSYYFPDEAFARLYAGERRTAELFQLFALLSVLIACLGLFGLAAFTMEQRAKEIGIRKVLGASGFMIVLIALVTVGSRALGAALANPIKALRSE